jgi:hypothetical protein
LLNFYFTDMHSDINESAYALCESNEAVQARKFAKLKIKRTEAWTSPEGSLKIFALLTVSGEDSAFIKQVITNYMGSFPDYIKRASGRYFSSTGYLPNTSLQPTDWDAVFHEA